MNLRRTWSILLGSVALRGDIVRAQNATTTTTTAYEPLGIDGSGTTNPSKCFWHIMAKLNEQIKLPTQFSYRAVGSGTGIKEFLGVGIEDGEGNALDDAYVPYNDFGSGDIPIKAEDRSDALSRGIEFVQLPFALSAVTFFHSVPGVPSGEMGLSEFHSLPALSLSLFTAISSCAICTSSVET
jgi:ABC-type phosphate transport system substrate-binding protein